ncbi:hypothetical protein AYI92_06455 [Shewanella xiamenensis]|uniref:hypothetical protein n=1 Tax=Shewanella xiamenensis TaxID=332186 RepID=UPI00118595FA|nr:hypothetical protein [Shewanella xiamenensis]TVL21133.1 hypothetical protein AYI90_06835 [Shewanella xiamenensis]TVL21374.1 hypothetical protein AYI91_08035 [Shewanella xiamenensis]TVL27341.1 hypothetical protein AYI92_06455 [Shewanella xiamenensis]TVL34888.1 hypothetical protein AYI93_07070 [Shewanella xiamenensis]TVP03534.1 hypothetical protein AYI89_07055 [Shewanella xiamenensis]
MSEKTTNQLKIYSAVFGALFLISTAFLIADYSNFNAVMKTFPIIALLLTPTASIEGFILTLTVVLSLVGIWNISVRLRWFQVSSSYSVDLSHIEFRIKNLRLQTIAVLFFILGIYGTLNLCAEFYLQIYLPIRLHSLSSKDLFDLISAWKGVLAVVVGVWGWGYIKKQQSLLSSNYYISLGIYSKV